MEKKKNDVVVFKIKAALFVRRVANHDTRVPVVYMAPIRLCADKPARASRINPAGLDAQNVRPGKVGADSRARVDRVIFMFHFLPAHSARPYGGTGAPRRKRKTSGFTPLRFAIYSGSIKQSRAKSAPVISRTCSRSRKRSYTLNG